MFFAPLLVFVILWVKDGSNTELINQSLERENNFFNFSLTAEKLSNQTVSFENWKKKISAVLCRTVSESCGKESKSI